EDLGDRVEPWQFEFPVNNGVPGQGGELPTPWQILQILLGWAREVFEATSAAPPRETVTGDRLDRIVARAAEQVAAVVAAGAAVVSGLRHAVDAVVGAVANVAEDWFASCFLHAAQHHAGRQADDASLHRRHDHDVILWLLRGFMTWI